MKTHLLLVGGGKYSAIHGHWYEKAREMDIDLSVADNPGHFAEGYASSGLIHAFHPIDLFAEEKVLTKELLDILKNSGIDFSGIFTFFDALLVPVAVAAQALGLPTIEPDRYRTVTDKGSMREAIGSPVQFSRVTSAEDLARAAEVVGFPCIMKPSNGTASLGVIEVSEPESLIDSYNTISEVLPSVKDGCTPVILLEKKLVGTEHAVDIIVEKGHLLFVSIADAHAMVSPRFQETGRTTPSKLETAKQNEMVRHVKDMCTSASLTDGVFHLECMYTSDGPQLIEFNARPGCLLVAHSVLAVWGVELIKTAFAMAIGLPIPTLPSSGVLGGNRPQVLAVCKYPPVPFTGYVHDLRFMDVFENDPRIKVRSCMVEVGQKVLGADDERPGHLCVIMMVGEDSIQNVEAVADNLIGSVDWASFVSKTKLRM